MGEQARVFSPAGRKKKNKLSNAQEKDDGDVQQKEAADEEVERRIGTILICRRRKRVAVEKPTNHKLCA